MAEVVSPRGVTYRVTCHQWLRKGESSMRTLPTICVHICSVSRVSFHASYGNDGHSSALILSPVCCLASILISIYLSLIPIALPPRQVNLSFYHKEGVRKACSYMDSPASLSAASNASCSQDPG